MTAKSKGSARKGRAVEGLVASSCILATAGELNALTAFVDDEGVDITFKRRNGTKTLDIQVKSRFSDEAGSKALREDDRFVADVREATFRAREDLFMLFVAADATKAEFGPVWLVPSLEFELLGQRVNPKKTGKQVRISASAKSTSKDKWSPFRLDRTQLPEKLITILEESEA